MTLAIVTIGLIAAAVLLSAWYSGAETGLYQLNRIDLQMRSLQGDRRAKILSGLLNDQRGVICTLLVGTNWTNYLAAMLVTSYLSVRGFSASETEVLTTAILTPIIFIFAETLPKNLFYQQSNRLMYASARFIGANVLVLKFTGILYLLKALNWLALRAVDAWTDVRQVLLPGHDLGGLLREGHAAGTLTAVQTDIAQRILRLPEVRIGRVMVPIWHAVAVPEDISRQQFLQIAGDNNYSRLPMYRGQRTNIVGIVNVYHVMADVQQCAPVEHLSAVIRVSPAEAIMPVLYRLQHGNNPMAVVVNDRAQAIGIVTIKDLVEEIVGELGQW